MKRISRKIRSGVLTSGLLYGTAIGFVGFVGTGTAMAAGRYSFGTKVVNSTVVVTPVITVQTAKSGSVIEGAFINNYGSVSTGNATNYSTNYISIDATNDHGIST